MKTDNLGRAILDSNDLLDVMYQGTAIDNLLAEQDIVEKYNSTLKKLKVKGDGLLAPNEIDQIEFDNSNQQNWYMPLHYKNLDVNEYINNLVKTDEEKNRVAEEMELYNSFNLHNVLRFLIYLIDTMRAHGIVWGVGRGSSVASYVLYLIGVHKVNSIKYKLDIHEFLR
jgi:DNA polymerase III alpha subunit|tara:strand:+ start:1230 stop:1736 length:507 start_codon:yes stop_codon:yes gene_type:complete